MADVQDFIKLKELKTEKTLPATGAYTVTNKTADRTHDCNAAFAEAGFFLLADVLGTLIDDLKTKGILE